ncbi:Signal peptidase complex catalytic subunit [Savitreella phatthalungensis]
MLDFSTLSIRSTLLQFLNLCLVGTGAFMSWKALSLAVDCESPVVVVLSGSMEPAFQRGDLLFLTNLPTYAGIGDVVVYNVQERKIPIVHRVIQSFKTADVSVKIGNANYRRGESNKGARVNPFAQPNPPLQKQYLLTKGDNNDDDDKSLYHRGQSYLERDEDVVGIVRGFMPYVGMVTLAMNDYPFLRVLLLGGMAITAFLSKE